MANSQYLASAIRGMQVAPAAAQAPDVFGMAKQAQVAQAWKARNPGKSYLANNVRQFGQKMAQAPGNMVAPIGGLFGGQFGGARGSTKGGANQPPQPSSGAILQDMEGGNALPKFTLPAWALDGTDPSDPSAQTYFDVSALNPNRQKTGRVY